MLKVAVCVPLAYSNYRITVPAFLRQHQIAA